MDTPASLQDVRTLAQLLAWRIRATPAGMAYRWFDPTAATWTSLSWAEFGARVEILRTALARSGACAQGDRIAILMPNGIDHVSMDQAALSLGLAVVPMHAIDNPDSIGYILSDSEAAVLLVESHDRWRAIMRTGQPLPNLKLVLIAKADAQDAGAVNDPRVQLLRDWSARAPEAATGDFKPPAPQDMAAIVYTSGTTGRPKGVMLSHGNVVSNVKAIVARIEADPADVFLSFLPLSHTFERTAGYYYPIATAATVAFSRSTRDLPQDLKVVRPTVLASVPRIYERFYAAISAELDRASFVNRKMFELAAAVGARRFRARQERTPASLLDQALWPLLEMLVARKIKAQLGGRLRVGVSGGAPIAPGVIGLFLSMGIDIVQGYGMTETSPVVSTNTPDDNDPATVGRPLDGVEVRIGENNELLVRGPNVMLGYWKNPVETRRVLSADGWLHTGDQAALHHGRITITGRIKDIIVTSTGEKVAPADLELAILADPLFEQVMIVGERRPYLSVLAVLQKAALADLQKTTTSEGLPAMLLSKVRQSLRAFPSYAMPKAIWWTSAPWTIENGLLTPTLKIKRLALEARFKTEIETMYGGSNGPAAATDGGRQQPA